MRVALAAVLMVAVGVFQPARASYVHLTLGDMVKRADAIVLGRVVAVSASTFDMKVDEVVVQKKRTSLKAGETLRVEKFEDWTCASRWRPYAAGDELLFALVRSEKQDGRWSTMGAAAEGEMPIENGQVYIGGNGDGMPRGSNKHRVYGADFWGESFPRQVVVEAIRTRKLTPVLKAAPFRPRAGARER